MRRLEVPDPAPNLHPQICHQSLLLTDFSQGCAEQAHRSPAHEDIPAVAFQPGLSVRVSVRAV